MTLFAIDIKTIALRYIVRFRRTSYPFPNTRTARWPALSADLAPVAVDGTLIDFPCLILTGRQFSERCSIRCAAAFAGLCLKQPVRGNSLICLKTAVLVTELEDAAKGLSIMLAGVTASPMDRDRRNFADSGSSSADFE